MVHLAPTGFPEMNNPLRILQTLDRHLTKPAELTIFGRSALALGFKGSPPAFATTQDVDGILPMEWLAAEDENIDFWEAQQKTNAELEPEGLYITHLFREFEVILTPSWITRRVSVDVALSKLKVLRPAILDLILTKMARGDENDLVDIRFLLQQEELSPEQLRDGFKSARVPQVPEILELFQASQRKVLEVSRSIQASHG
jgi:hypothetical protein